MEEERGRGGGGRGREEQGGAGREGRKDGGRERHMLKAADYTRQMYLIPHPSTLNPKPRRTRQMLPRVMSHTCCSPCCYRPLPYPPDYTPCRPLCDAHTLSPSSPPSLRLSLTAALSATHTPSRPLPSFPSLPTHPIPLTAHVRRR